MLDKILNKIVMPIVVFISLLCVNINAICILIEIFKIDIPTFVLMLILESIALIFVNGVAISISIFVIKDYKNKEKHDLEE